MGSCIAGFSVSTTVRGQGGDVLPLSHSISVGTQTVSENSLQLIGTMISMILVVPFGVLKMGMLKC